MKPADLRDHEHGTTLTTEVCVIGSGPAGAVVALEVAAAGVDVVVVESGGWDLEPDTNELYELDNIGLPRLPQDEIRVRQFGGSSTRWTGRCAPFRRIDFADRPWVPMSGWPFTLDDLEPHLGRAAAYLGLAPLRYDSAIWTTFDGTRPEHGLDTAKLVDEVWQFSSGVQPGHPVRVDVDLRERIEAEQHLRVLLHANVLEIVPTDNGRQVDHVVVSTLEGRRATVQARTVVVCAGGIESARLLLASRSVVPTGLGNSRDLVGRYYMEHPYCEVGTFSVDEDWTSLLTRFGHYWHTSPRGKQVFMSGMVLSPRVQHEQELLNACMYILTEDDENAAVNAARRLATGTGDTSADVKALLSRPMELAEAARRRQLEGLPPIIPPTHISLGVNAEQRPDPQSRITLSDRTDRLGVPLTKLDWRMDEQEIATIRTMFDLVRTELARVGLPTPTPAPWLDSDDWRSHFVDTAHHSCSVRMATDPSRGVTDPWGRVFDVDGLYVAGSALFPTVGTANPTLMLTSVALRVADAVRERHTSGAPDIANTAAVAAAPRRKARLGVIGTGHRVRTVYRDVLDALDDEVEVVGVVSRSAEGRATGAELFDTRSFDSADSMLDQVAPDALVVAVSGEANHDLEEQLVGCGRPVLFETPWAWSVPRGARILDAVPRGAGIGVAEQFPFLPMERLRARIVEAGVIGQVRAVHNESRVWNYHGIALARRLLSPMSRPSAVQAAGFELGLAGPGEPESARSGYNATVTFSDGSVLSQRFVNFYDPPLRTNHRLTVDGALGSIVDDELRFLGPDGSVLEATLRRITSDDRLLAVEAECGPYGTIRWENPWPDAELTDEQIAVADHVRAIAGAVAGASAPLYPPSEALADIEIMAAIDASVHHGGTVRLPFRASLERARELTDRARLAGAARRIAGGIRSRIGS